MSVEMMNGVFVKARAKRAARIAMIDASVRALPIEERYHLRLIATFGFGVANVQGGCCIPCQTIIDTVRANYRQLYAEVYK